MSNKDLMAQLQDLQTKYEDKVQKVGKPAFVELSQPCFDACPELEAIAWTQYAPHFNDGDACTFSVNDVGYFSKTYAEESEDFDPYDGDLGGYSDKGDLASKAKKAFDAFDKFLQGTIGSDVAERVFGDGYKIVIRRDGTVEVDEYRHD